MKNFILILCVLFTLTSSVFAEEAKPAQDVEIENSSWTRIKVQKGAEDKQLQVFVYYPARAEKAR